MVARDYIPAPVVQRLSEQVAVVTGGARGIGRGITVVLASEGAHVVICDIDPDAAASAAAELGGQGLSVSAVETDVTDRRSVEEMAERVLAECGRIDILAANAGIFPSTHLSEIDDALWNRVLDVNVTGAVRAVQACMPPMVAANYGRIVLTSSITGPITGQPGYTHYGASKAAMLGFMRSAALEVAANGVTVNAVMPGNVATEGFATTSSEHQRQMLQTIPLGYYADPEDVGWAVRFLASPEARYITGQTLIVDGGQVLPEAPPLEHG
jgi:3-oxoacyl-[acyl-carrier protein] reductase